MHSTVLESARWLRETRVVLRSLCRNTDKHHLISPHGGAGGTHFATKNLDLCTDLNRGSVATNSLYVMWSLPVLDAPLRMVVCTWFYNVATNYMSCDPPLAWSQKCGFSFWFGGNLKGQHKSVRNVEVQGNDWADGLLGHIMALFWSHILQQRHQE